MAFKTCGRPCKVKGRVSTGLSGSTSSRLPSLCLGNPDKLASTLVLPPRPPNIPAAALETFGTSQKINLNEEVQDIIQAILEAGPAATESHWECLFKTRFPNVYRGINYMVCYNFC